MCMFCAAVPVTAAVGARLNAGQLNKSEEQHRPIAKITGIVITLLIVTSIIYHTLIWRS